MSALIAEIVDRAIRHTLQMSKSEGYDWPTAREALVRILTDLEKRAPDHESLGRLRGFITARDRGSERQEGGGAPD